jgi:hypothetical protein
MTDDYRPNTERPSARAAIYARPIRVILFGPEFAACDGSETLGLSASGPDALKTLAIPAPVLRRIRRRPAAVKEVGR